MFQIVAHVKPTGKSSFYGRCKGAYAVLFINYKDIYGAFELAKFYIETEDWKIIELEEEYFTIDSEEDMTDDYKQYYEQMMEDGYLLVFNLYEAEED